MTDIRRFAESASDGTAAGSSPGRGVMVDGTLTAKAIGGLERVKQIVREFMIWWAFFASTLGLVLLLNEHRPSADATEGMNILFEALGVPMLGYPILLVVLWGLRTLHKRGIVGGSTSP